MTLVIVKYCAENTIVFVAVVQTLQTSNRLDFEYIHAELNNRTKGDVTATFYGVCYYWTLSWKSFVSLKKKMRKK